MDMTIPRTFPRMTDFNQKMHQLEQEFPAFVTAVEHKDDVWCFHLPSNTERDDVLENLANNDIPAGAYNEDAVTIQFDTSSRDYLEDIYMRLIKSLRESLK